jgi:hypothetical protein
VATSHRRRHVAVVCNVETVSHDSFLRNFVTYVEANGDVRSAMQYQNEMYSLKLDRPEGMELTIRDHEPVRGGEKEKKNAKQTAAVKNKKQEQDFSPCLSNFSFSQKQELISSETSCDNKGGEVNKFVKSLTFLF